nr:protein NATD1-like isoform X4 [Procambarus clarkii]
MVWRAVLRLCSPSKQPPMSVMMMSSQVAAPRVLHDQDNYQFYITTGTDKAYLQYDIDPAIKVADLQHTFVPEAFRGQGYGKILAKAAFDYFVESNQHMKLTCWYLQKYYKENPLPQYQEKIKQHR